MDRGFLLPDRPEIDGPRLAEQADAQGYNSVWIPELWGDNAFARLADLAHRVDCALGSAIVNVFSRSPAVIAAGAATLDDIAPGRYTLGLGVSTAKAVEDLHGQPFERPVRRGEEAVELVKQFTGGAGRVSYDGEIFTVQDFPAKSAAVPIYYAALGPANRRVVGRVADGWIPHNIPFSRLDAVFETIETAAETVDRDSADITIAPYVPCAIHENREKACAAIAGHIAYYVGSGDGYRKAVRAGFGPPVDAIAKAWQAGNRDLATDRVTGEMIDDLGVAATPSTAQSRFRDLLSRTSVDHPIVVVPAQAADTLAETTMEALAPE